MRSAQGGRESGALSPTDAVVSAFAGTDSESNAPSRANTSIEHCRKCTLRNNGWLRPYRWKARQASTKTLTGIAAR